ncbi:hypothetical protein PITC_038770 [Penicillium italicum]|uniref:Uncharacterized protein n=1 Tax=Penicillium italicum TaxID=40296 RepID=A0A0A2KK66_PENIT|nr:hypothetical protein PITC_038770 [Penicillium italicum]
MSSIKVGQSFKAVGITPYLVTNLVFSADQFLFFQ